MTRVLAGPQAVVLLLLCAAPALLPAQAPAPPAPAAVLSSAPEIEFQESRSEALAAELMGLAAALRERESERIAHFLAPGFSGRLPSEAEAPTRRRRLVLQHGWSPPPGPALDPAAFTRAFAALLGHFPVREDVRLEVEAADFATSPGGESGSGTVRLLLVGRDEQGRREWLRGTARVRVAPGADGRWKLAAFDLEAASSLVAERELFLEVSVPAGLAVARPEKRRPGNFGAIWHGAAAADLDRDGWVDIAVTSRTGLRVYRNEGGRRFTDAADAEARTAPGATTWSAGPASPLAFDYDGDGDLDLFVSAVGPQVLLENRMVPEGRLRFRDVSAASGMAVSASGYSAVAGDVNQDGRPDVYVTGYNAFGRVTPNSWFAATNGTPNLLFVNQGDGTFREEARARSVDDPRWSLAAAIADVDGDARGDVLVANDFGEKGLFINKGARFQDEARARGFLDPGFGMGISLGDYDADGVLDLHATNMSSVAGQRILRRLYPRPHPLGDILHKLAAGNSLFHGLGGGRFEDVSARLGPFPGGWAWGGGFADLDNDGWPDLYTTNGYRSGGSRRDTASHFWRQVVTHAEDPLRNRGRQDQPALVFEQGYSFNGHERDTVFLNEGGASFLEVSGITGLDSPSDGRAAVLADLDNDGDLDVFLTTHEGPAHLLFRNDAGDGSAFLRFALLGGPRSGTDAFGAVVRLRVGARVLTQAKLGGSGFLSQHDPRLLFGLGEARAAESVEVAWPDGAVEKFTGDLTAGRSLLLRQGTGVAAAVLEQRGRLPDALSPGERVAHFLKVQVGQPLPRLVLTTAAREAHPLPSLLQPGRRTLLVPWTADCGACRGFLSLLTRRGAALAAAGLDVVAVNVDTAPEVDVGGALRQMALGFPAYFGGVWALDLLFAADDPPLPMALVVDDAGRLAEVLAGSPRHLGDALDRLSASPSPAPSPDPPR